MTTTNEEWTLLHALQGHDKNGHCVLNKRCADPVCESGCLGQNATEFRAQIMHGIAIARDQGDARWPESADYYMNPDGKKCPTTGWQCVDAVCTVSGCLDVPAWKFRDLIKLERDEILFKALRTKVKG